MTPFCQNTTGPLIRAITYDPRDERACNGPPAVPPRLDRTDTCFWKTNGVTRAPRSGLSACLTHRDAACTQVCAHCVITRLPANGGVSGAAYWACPARTVRSATPGPIHHPAPVPVFHRPPALWTAPEWLLFPITVFASEITTTIAHMGWIVKLHSPLPARLS